VTQARTANGARVALVTGATRGIGLATAQAFLDQGDRVVVWDVDTAALATAWGDAADGRVLTDAVDVADPDSCAAGTVRLLSEFGRLDVVVNNAALHAGMPWLGDCLDLDLAGWQRILGVNVLGTINVVRATVDALAERAGVVVNISSMAANGRLASSPYAVTKAALNGVTSSLADELGRRGIRVVGIAPGFVATDAVIKSIGMDRARTARRAVRDDNNGPAR
jgi:3-oxoacyl-[acyl-carrier protein] reductase